MKRIIFSVLVLGFLVFAGAPAEARRPSGAITSFPCLGGTINWQPNTVTSSQPLMLLLALSALMLVSSSAASTSHLVHPRRQQPG